MKQELLIPEDRNDPYKKRYENLDLMVGLDGQYFKMDIGLPHVAGQVFSNGNMQIQCVDKNTFVIKSDKRDRFLTKRNLIKNKFLPLS